MFKVLRTQGLSKMTNFVRNNANYCSVLSYQRRTVREEKEIFHEYDIHITIVYVVYDMQLGGLNAVLTRRQSCVEAYAEDAQAPASSFVNEKEGSLSKA